jgi:hypothetical protein
MVAVQPFEKVALKVAVKSPYCVGVPVICPVTVLKLIPAGSPVAAFHDVRVAAVVVVA